MRFLIALLIGLLAGALLTSMLMRSLAAGSAYPKGVMAVQAAHFSALGTLRILAADVEPAFKTLAEQDPQFVRYAADLRRVLDLQLAKGIDNCADLNTGLSSVKQACENCHRDYQ